MFASAAKEHGIVSNQILYREAIADKVSNLFDVDVGSAEHQKADWQAHKAWCKAHPYRRGA